MDNSKSKEILVKYYINGKSFEELTRFANEFKIESIDELLREINLIYSSERKKMGKRDLGIALSVWLVFLLLMILKIIGVSIVLHFHLMFISLAVGVTFFRSYLKIHSAMKEDY